MQEEEITPKGEGTFVKLWLEEFVGATLSKAEEKDCN
jgi:hypothetical protein